MARAIPLSVAGRVSPSGARAANLTVGARLAARQTQIDFLRLLAALLVIFSHYYALRDGDNAAEPYHRLGGYCNFGKLAVYCLFFISGLLAGRSFLARANPITYLWNRARRVFPALWLCVAFCILVVGPLLTTLPLRSYFTNAATLQFAGNAILLPNHYDLPGVFGQYAHGDPRAAIDGSLWSIPCGMLMFFAIAVLGTLRLLNRKSIVALVTLVMLGAWLAFQYGFIAATPGTLLYRHRIWVEFLPHLGFFFFAGALVFLYRERIVPDARLLLVCLAAIVLTWRAVWPNAIGYVVFTLCLPYIITYFAFARIPLVGRALQSVNRLGDFSYGVYLYGYPVQQLLIGLWGPRLSPAMHIGFACLGSLVLAALSWHLIERRFVIRRTTSS